MDRVDAELVEEHFEQVLDHILLDDEVVAEVDAQVEFFGADAVVLEEDCDEQFGDDVDGCQSSVLDDRGDVVEVGGKDGIFAEQVVVFAGTGEQALIALFGILTWNANGLGVIYVAYFDLA